MVAGKVLTTFGKQSIGIKWLVLKNHSVNTG